MQTENEKSTAVIGLQLICWPRIIKYGFLHITKQKTKIWKIENNYVFLDVGLWRISRTGTEPEL